MEEKKLYFMSVSMLDDGEYVDGLSDEEFKKRATHCYDSIEHFTDDFNNEYAPSDIEYFCRYC